MRAAVAQVNYSATCNVERACAATRDEEQRAILHVQRTVVDEVNEETGTCIARAGLRDGAA